jgi:hypothetical protein
MHIVEVCRKGKLLIIAMAEMRNWLDHNRVEPALFRLTMVPEGVVFRLDFTNASDAAGFAKALKGQVIGEPGYHTLAA